MKKKEERHGSTNRRKFLSAIGGATGAAVVSNAIALPAFVALSEKKSYADDIGPQQGQARAERSERFRAGVAELESNVPIPPHEDNGDEARYPNKIGSYSKNLLHDPHTGEVDPAAYQALIAAISSGRFADFEALATDGYFGCPDPALQRRLVDPGSGYAYDLEGTDSHQLGLQPAPAFASAQEAGEMVELYWMSLLRDINFANYAGSPLAQAAADDLSNLSDFRGPKISGRVTPQTLFRDKYPGCTVGPYISQFLLQPVNFGSQRIDTRMQTVAPNVDYMANFTDWLKVQNGYNTPAIPVTGALGFCINGRSLSHYVHIDALFEAYFVACVNLLAGGYLANTGNPYGRVIDGGAGRPRNLTTDPNGSLSQVGFGTFGGPSILTLVCEPATRALKAVWYQKWLVHRRLRPEEFGGRVEVHHRIGHRSYPIHSDLLYTSNVLTSIFSKFGSHLLPMAFPEGSPMHTSYGSGHATVAGAAVTFLKAVFDENQVIQNPVVPDPGNPALLIPYVAPAGEPPLTVGGELNKVVSNVSQGRNIAGVHWRSDANESNVLGESVTISILRDMRRCYSEPFSGYTFTKFDGTCVTV